MRDRSAWPSVLALALLVGAAPSVRAQEEAKPPAAVESPEVATPTAAVALDGEELFRVRGISSFPAEKRADAIASRIAAVAADHAVRPEDVGLAEVDGVLQIMAGKQLVMAVLEADARVEGVQKTTLAKVHLQRVREAVAQYRAARSRAAVVRSSLLAVAAIVGFALAAALLVWLFRKLTAHLEARFHRRVRSFGVKSFEIVRAERVWGALKGALGLLRTVLLVTLGVLGLNVVLGLFPWTRSAAHRITGYVARPLGVMLEAFLATLPDLVFLAVLYLVVRYLLGLLRLFFEAVEQKTVTFDGFDPEWAVPTYKMVRIAVVAFAIVVAYPYIPGSGSAAFKGVSLFLGVVFSLGSSSVIANTIAGYSMTYRRAFRVGDRVRIGDVTGDVTEIRLQVTHLRTPKNEEVIVPNSEILGASIVNFSRLAVQQGLILHTTVGIGYETPWRQVEAMLLLAADRAPGFLKEPRPFVLQTALGDFCVTYEINVFCDAPQRMAALYTELHRHILDVFNEYGVQIMTPAYEGDPEQPKVVPKDQWFLGPARRETGEGDGTGG